MTRPTARRQRDAAAPRRRRPRVVAALTAAGLLPALALPLLAGPAADAASAAAAHAAPAWRLEHTGGPADLRALAPISRWVVWASGSAGTVLRTTDGGAHWQSVGPPGTTALEFRGLAAFDARTAVVMSVGNHPGDFRIYRTADGGRHWLLANRNANPQAFYDCMAFFDRRVGLVLSDPVNGRFRILRTTDGGRHWRVIPASGMPPAHSPNEYGFAASNTCLTTHGRSQAWFGSGGPAGSRLFHSTDAGRTWTVTQTPIARGTTKGIYSLAFRTGLQGLAIGGDYTTPYTASRALALTADGGRTWTLVGAAAAPGRYRSGAAWVPGTVGTALAVGTSGSDVSTDGGYRWRLFDGGSFDAVVCAPDHSCWASGVTERIGLLTWR